MYVIHESLRNKPKSRVELHIHLDGAIRPETIWEIMRKKQLQLPGDGSLSALKHTLKIHEPVDLLLFLKSFSIFMPAFKGDLEAIERFSYEFVEDQAVESIAYCEARLCPHLLLPDSQIVCNGDEATVEEVSESANDASNPKVTAKDILEAALRGLKRGEEKFGTKVRLILCCIRAKQEWSWEILKLCEDYRNDGVVGIDIAGDENCAGEGEHTDEIKVFEAAKARGIHRTIHAGEEAGWESVKQAITVLGAERVGHGYRVLENEEFYQKCIQDGIHFEMCPHSSYMTGAIKGLNTASKRHPILRLAEDRASFSINSDDPTVTGTHISEEYELLRRWGFTEAHFARANFEAASRSFLPPEEKQELLLALRDAYGVPEIQSPAPQVDGASSPTTTVKASQSAQKPAIKFASWEERTY